MPGDHIRSLRQRVRRPIAVQMLCCVLALTAALYVAHEGLANQGSIAGQMLVASERMGDPRFAETVIYMIEHDNTGALGLVVNRPLGNSPVARILQRLGLDPESALGSIGVHAGGPVEPGRIFVLHSAEVMAVDSKAVADDIAVAAGPEILRLIGQGAGPKHSLFFLGYAGWGPGQLDGELARADWFVIPAERDLVFATDPAQTWQEAVKRRAVDL